MYQQVNNSFSQGTQDYITAFEQFTKQQRKLVEEHKEPVLAQIQQYNDQMKLHGTQVAAEIASNLQRQFDNVLRNTNAILQDTIISSVKAIIKEELQFSLKEQQHLIQHQMRLQSGANTPINHLSGSNSFHLDRSGGITPAPNQDASSQITNFLQKGKFLFRILKASI